jgi:hypothetical protein
MSEWIEEAMAEAMIEAKRRSWKSKKKRVADNMLIIAEDRRGSVSGRLGNRFVT